MHWKVFAYYMFIFHIILKPSKISHKSCHVKDLYLPWFRNINVNTNKNSRFIFLCFFKNSLTYVKVFPNSKIYRHMNQISCITINSRELGIIYSLIIDSYIHTQLSQTHWKKNLLPTIFLFLKTNLLTLQIVLRFHKDT